MGYYNYDYNRRCDRNRTETFFSDYPKERKTEIKNHYSILEGDLIDLSQSLNIIMNNKLFVPDWIQRLEIQLPKSLNFTDFVERHLKKDNHDLLKNIDDFIKEIEGHNRNLLTFREGLRQSIGKKFKEKDIEITNNPNIGFYYDDYVNLLNLQFTSIINCLQRNCNLDELKSTLNFSLNQRDGFILMGGSLVGNADNELVRNNIIELIKNIPFHKDILDELKNLHQSLLNIQEKSDMIQPQLHTIIQNIQRNQYKTLTKCCPKRFFFF